MVKPIPRVVSAILGGGSPAGLPSIFPSLSAAFSHLPVHMSVPLLLVALICVYPVSLSPVGQSAILLLVLSVISLASPDSACLPAARPPCTSPRAGCLPFILGCNFPRGCLCPCLPISHTHSLVIAVWLTARVAISRSCVPTCSLLSLTCTVQ